MLNIHSEHVDLSGSVEKFTYSILLIEDNEIDYENVRRELYMYGGDVEVDFAITWTTLLADGLVAVGKENFDVILLDLSLPDSSGLASYKKLKERAPDVPVVVVTGVDDESLALKMVEAGAQDYVVKDSIPGVLARRILYASQRQEILQDLETAERETRNSAQSKSAFFASMSHEIRNPLTAIIGYSEALMDSALDEKDSASALSAIFSNGKHLLQVINDILDISKIEAGEMKIEEVTDNLIPLLRDIKQTFDGRAKEKDLVFSIDLQAPLPELVNTDFFRLKQILYNLIGNAVKFTKEGFIKVHIRVDEEQERLLFDVRDSGVGIPERAQETLFKAFSQGDASRTREFGGTGLGLVISQQLAERLGGGLSFQSREGIGTVFTLDLPLKDIGRNSLSKQLPSIEQDTKRIVLDASGSIKGRVLIVDDMEDNRNLISLLLSRLGLEIDTAENGRVALEKIPEGNFDLILLDMQMPEVDGREVARTLRAEGSTIPIIAVTASFLDESLQENLKAGCDYCLSKPFRREELVESVLRFLSEDRESDLSDSKPTVRHDELDEVRRGFLKRLPERLETIETALENEDLTTLKAEAHRIIAAGLFGYHELSQLGGILESMILQEETGGLTLVEALVKKVRGAVGRIALDDSAPSADGSSLSEQTTNGSLLVVDDDLVNLKVVCRNLNVKGFLATPARSVEEALESCAEDPCAVLVVSLELQSGAGKQLVSDVRKKLEKNIPVIAMTSRPLAEAREALSDVEIQHLLPKPISRDKLLEAIDSLIFASLSS